MKVRRVAPIVLSHERDRVTFILADRYTIIGIDDLAALVATHDAADV